MSEALRQEPRLDLDGLEAMTKERCNEAFFKGSGVIKLVNEIRRLRAMCEAARAGREGERQMPDDLVFNLLDEIDKAAVRVDIGEFGLPMRNAEFMQSARAQIQWHFDAASKEPT